MLGPLREFLENSTIHGLVFISTSSSRLVKLFWLTVVVTGFSVSTWLIVRNLRAWDRSPISTTIATEAIKDVDFPTVIVCPPPNTFTGLHLDLEMTRNIKLDNDTLQTLLDFIPTAVFDASFETKYEKFLSFGEENRFMNWYLGLSTISFPYVMVLSYTTPSTGRNFVRLDVKTRATSGAVATPHFKQRFNERNFETHLYYLLEIEILEDVPYELSTLIVEVEHDLEEISYVEYVRVNSENIDTTEEKVTLEYPLDTGSVIVEYNREIREEDMKKWEKKRNTGMRVRWYYSKDVTSQPPLESKNRVLTQLANVLHEQAEPGEVWREVKDFRAEFLQDGIQCEEWKIAHSYYLQLGLANFYGNVTSEPVYKDEISEETLETAAKMFVFMLHCPDRYGTINDELNFFDELFREKSKETIIKTLGSISSHSHFLQLISVQIIATAREKDLDNEMKTAKLLFRKTAEELKLYSKDVEIISSRLSEIAENEEMLSHYTVLSPCLHNGTEECQWWRFIGEKISQPMTSLQKCCSDRRQVRDINHPVHILDTDGNLSPSSFIPFCSFGGSLSLLGTPTDMFPVPVCTSFREKQYDGQLCYEIDVNEYKEKVDWQSSLQTGLSFIVDNNEEYDMKKIIFDTVTKESPNEDLLNAFAKSEVLKSFSVHLQTISIIFDTLCNS